MTCNSDIIKFKPTWQGRRHPRSREGPLQAAGHQVVSLFEKVLEQ